MVSAHMNWDTEKTRLWFHTKNPFFGDLSPLELFKLRPEKTVKVIEALIEENSK